MLSKGVLCVRDVETVCQGALVFLQVGFITGVSSLVFLCLGQELYKALLASAAYQLDPFQFVCAALTPTSTL